MTARDSSRKDQSIKKAYSPPRLRNHGRVSQLTAGGSGAMQETAMMGGPMGGTMRFP